MSLRLFSTAESFVRGEITVRAVVDAYIDGWREERDSGLALLDDDLLSEKLSSIFCLADLFNGDDHREKYEFDEDELRLKIRKIIALGSERNRF